MTDVVTMGIVGAVLGETIIVVKETIPTVEMTFQTRLTSILDRLDSLKLQIDKMREYDSRGRMDCPNEELRPICYLLIECKHVVKKCKKIRRWQIYDKTQCLKALEEMDNQIAGFCSANNVIAIISGDMKKAHAALSVMKDAMNAMFLKDELQLDPVNVVESTAVKETENIEGLEDVVLNNDIRELLDELEPTVMVESTASPEGYGKSTLVSDEQVTEILYEYDVFLSFRGGDTRESFTGTLFHFLSKIHKVKTFMDVIFRKGSKLEDLLKMIEKSRMSIVVFSENFAESEWCLKELAKIFEESDRRGHEVVPVFYKVNPSELRHQDTGKTKVHMEKHHSKYGKDSDTVKSWSNAMKELGNSSGYTYWSGRGKQEIELAEEIAQEILSRIHG